MRSARVCRLDECGAALTRNQARPGVSVAYPAGVLSALTNAAAGRRFACVALRFPQPSLARCSRAKASNTSTPSETQTMRYDPATLWSDFQISFCRAIHAADEAQMRAAWRSPGTRTHFYANELMSRVARDLGLEPSSSEWMTVDYTLWSRSDAGEPTPAVLIESENNSFDAAHEVRKLCSLAAPLRVLITVVEWEDLLPRWTKPGNRKALTERWRHIREAYSSAWPDNGIVGVLVGEWGPDHVLRFHAFELPTASEQPHRETVVLARPMQGPPDAQAT